MATRDDEKKTKEELLAEVDDLRRELAARGTGVGTEDEEAQSQPAFARPMTRRTALSTWVAPVILSIPLAAVSRPRAAQAQPPTSVGPTLPPTFAPTVRPTLPPTLVPTLAPTLAPTAFPTVAPTLAKAQAPVLSSAGAAAAVAAAAGFGAARLVRGAKGGAAAGDERLDGDDDAPDEDETK